METENASRQLKSLISHHTRSNEKYHFILFFDDFFSCLFTLYFPGHSLKRLLEPEDITVEDNPKIKQRLKENAITMNKMAELRTQMESLSMLKKTKRRISKKSRPKSGKRSSGGGPGSRGQSRMNHNPGSRMSTWSASTNGSSVIYKKKPGHIVLNFINYFINLPHCGMTLFRNKRFALNKMFQRNASKFSIFYV